MADCLQAGVIADRRDVLLGWAVPRYWLWSQLDFGSARDYIRCIYSLSDQPSGLWWGFVFFGLFGSKLQRPEGR